MTLCARFTTSLLAGAWPAAYRRRSEGLSFAHLRTSRSADYRLRRAGTAMDWSACAATGHQPYDAAAVIAANPRWGQHLHDYCRGSWHTNTDALRLTARMLTRPSTHGPPKGGSWLPQRSSYNLGKPTICIFESRRVKSRRVSRTILRGRRSLWRQRRRRWWVPGFFERYGGFGWHRRWPNHPSAISAAD